MENSTQMPKSQFHARCISLPTRSHPLFSSVLDEVEKIKQWETASSPTAHTVCARMSGLSKVYVCLHEVLHLPQPQQSLAHSRQKKFVEESLDASVRLVDMCGMARELLLHMKENAWDLQSLLRTRKGGEHGLDRKIQAHICSRKKVRRDIKKCHEALKQIEIKDVDSPLLEEDHHVQMLVKVLREVRSITIYILKSLLSWISPTKQKPKASRWSLVTMVVHKDKIACEKENEMNEVERVDHALFSCLPGYQAKKIVDAQMKLRELEACIESLERGQECLFRHLVQTRVSLLNIFAY